jgi:hypothetical protein
MKRSGLLLSFLIISLTNFVSAAFYDFSLESFLYSVGGPSTLIYVCLFMIFFGIIYFALLRAFRYNKAIAGGVSLAAALLAVYGFTTMNWNIESFFYSISLPEEILTGIIYFIVIIAIIWLIKKFKLCGTLMILGILLMGISSTDLIYENNVGFVIGAVLFLIGLRSCMKKRKIKSKFQEGLEKIDPHQPQNINIINQPGRDGRDGRDGPAGKPGKYPKPPKGPKPPKPEKPPKPGKPPKPSPTPGPTPPPKPLGVARFDVTVGRNQYSNPSGKKVSVTDLKKNNSTQIYIKNGGSGGVLNWAAASSKGLSITPTSGQLKRGQASSITVTVTDRSVSFTPHVSILGKRGSTGSVSANARKFIGQTIGKTQIAFKIK